MHVAVHTLLLMVLTRCTEAPDPVLASVTSPDAVGNSVDSASTITWADIPAGQPYSASGEYDDGGVGVLYDFARSFVNTCFPKGFPYDLVDKFINGNLDIMNEIQGIVMDILGYAIAVVVGFLFIIIFPIIGCCFCCCRCCGNCGGKRRHKEDPSASCKRKVFAVILLSLIVMASVGVACTFVSNDRMTTALSKVGDAATNNLDDVSTYLNNTVDQIRHVAKDNFDFTKNVIFRDLESLGYLVGIPVRDHMGTSGGISNTFDSALALQSVLDQAGSQLEQVLAELQYLQDNATLLSNELTTLATDIGNACPGGAPAPCPIDTTNLQMGFDPSTLPNFNSQKSQLDTVQSNNLTKTILEAKAEFDGIPDKVHTDTATVVADLKTQVNDFSSSAIDPVIDMTNDLSNNALGSVDLNSYSDMISDAMTDVSVYDKYRWYGGIGLSSIILLVVLLLFLGLTCGVFGSSHSDPPDKRGSLSNCGGNMLMAAVGLIFIFSWLFMLLTTLTFLIGAPLERFVCQPLTDPDLTVLTQLMDTGVLGEPVNGSFLGNMIFQDPSVDLSIAGVLQDCKNGKSAYTAFKLDNLDGFNLTALTDYKSKMDIDGQLDSINVDMSTIQIVTPDVTTQLNDFKSAVTGIDFTDFDVLAQDTVTADLTALETDVRNVDVAIADRILALKSGVMADTHTSKVNLATSTGNLKTTFDSVPVSVDNVIAALDAAEAFIQTNGSDVVKSEATNLATRLTSTVDSFVTNSLDNLKEEIGGCAPVYNVYASLIKNGLCRYMLDAFNGFWFSLGWCIFFLVPSVIFAVKLVKHYRTMQLPPGQALDGELGDVKGGGPPPASTSPPPFSNKVAHADKW